MPETTVHVPGISCGHCVSTIESELGSLAGVTAVSANLDSKDVTVTWDDGGVSLEGIRARLDDIGYPVEEA